MRVRYLSVIFACAFASLNVAFAEEPGAAASQRSRGVGQPSNCFITVRYTRKSGATAERVFRSHEKSRKDCERAGRLHETNFAPGVVAEKTVRVRWEGGLP